MNKNKSCYKIQGEANVFARYLLMPEKEMQEIIDFACRDCHSFLREDMIRELVKIFQVPDKVASDRLVDFGF